MKSFVEYSSETDFPIENLPYGVFTSSQNVSNTSHCLQLNLI